MGYYRRNISSAIQSEDTAMFCPNAGRVKMPHSNSARCVAQIFTPSPGRDSRERKKNLMEQDLGGRDVQIPGRDAPPQTEMERRAGITPEMKRVTEINQV